MEKCHTPTEQDASPDTVGDPDTTDPAGPS
jgi:hypothetical protein